MKNGDMRAACLALIKGRIGALGRPGEPAALGWKLVNGDVPAAELAALCAAWMSDPSEGADLRLEPYWRPSPLLRAFITEYQKVRAAAPCAAAAGRAPAARPRRPSLERHLSTH